MVSRLNMLDSIFGNNVFCQRGHVGTFKRHTNSEFWRASVVICEALWRTTLSESPREQCLTHSLPFVFTQGIFSPGVPADNDRRGHIFDLKDCRLGYNLKWQVLVSVGYLSDVTSGRLCLKSLCHSASPRQYIYIYAYLYCCCFTSHTLVYGDLFSLSYDVSPVCVSKNLNHFHKGLGGKIFWLGEIQTIAVSLIP